jgi:hypothetical protein
MLQVVPMKLSFVCSSPSASEWFLAAGLDLVPIMRVYRPENVPAFIEAVKRREKVLSGFGHRFVFFLQN